MARLVLAAGLLGAGLGVAPAARAEAAAPAPPVARGRHLTTPQLLQEAVARGEIDAATADQHLAEVFIGGGSSKVPARFQSDEPWDGTLPLRRLQQRLGAQHSSLTAARTEAALAASTSCGSSTTPLPNEASSAHFSLAYGTIGGGLTFNSYLTSLETSYAKEVTSYGWAAPPTIPSAGLGGKYPVRTDTLTNGLFGFTAFTGTGTGTVGDNPNTPWNDMDASATCIVLERDYSGRRTPPQASLDATTAHEFNHAIQFGYGADAGSNGASELFIEAGATWMEDEVYDNANDNYAYLWPNFRDSLGDYDQLKSGTTDSYPYPMWLAIRGLTERFGTGIPGGGEQVMQDFWENTSKEIGNNLSALDIALQNKGVTLRDAYHDYAIGAGFMRPCGGGYVLPYCFEEASGYVAKAGLPPVAGAIASVGGAPFTSTIEDDYSLAWVTLPTTGTYSLTLSNTSDGGQLRATAVCDTGSTLVRSPFPAVAGPGTSTTLTSFSAGSCVRTLAVITNQQQSPGRPFDSPSRSFRLAAGLSGPNVAPVANGDSYKTFEGTPLTIAAPGVLANDTDANGDLLTATNPTAATGGTVSFGTNGAFTFTPTPGFTGTASFGYTANDGNGGSSSAAVTITVGPRPTYVPLSPARLMDTRSVGATVDGSFAANGAIAPGTSRILQVTGRGGVPTTPVGAVALNITALAPSAGFLTVYPFGETRPLASNLNFGPGQTIPNLVIAKVGVGGQLSIYNDTGDTNVIADVAGWFPTGGGYTPLSPARLMDSRSVGSTVDGAFQAAGAVAPGATRTLQLTGRGGVPASGVGAVVLNVTAAGPSGAGFLTVFPTGETRPLASNLNFDAGVTIPNLVIAKVGSGGQVSIYNDTGSTDVIADVAGWFPTGGGYTALSPARLVDTRSGGATVDGISQGTGALAPGATRNLQVTGRGGVPVSGVGAVVLNITATSPTVGGFLTVFPNGEAKPLASNLNFGPGQTIPNLVIAKVGPGGQVSIYNDSGSVQIIADVAGWLPAVA